jgi:RNA polymerase sigma-70 factor (ECF subfamily)
MRRIQNDPDADATAVSLLAQLAGGDPTPSRIVRRDEALEAIAQAVRSLPEDRRELIDLRYRQGMPIEEIARRLGKSEGSVKMLLNRTVKELQSLISSNFGDISAGA